MTQRTMSDHDALAELDRRLPDGRLLAGSPGATAAATGAGSPDAVAQPRTAAEVATILVHAREHDLPLTVRAGGHSMAGASTAAGGLLLDLSRLDGVTVDPATRRVSIGGGARWGQVAAALQPYGLALTAGDTAEVGVGGLTLGGGIGWMVRRYGLAIDNLVGAQIVTASGAILDLSAEQHPELFWAVRGGGGGLGVVTRFDFLAHEVTDVVFGTVVYALDDVAALLRGWRDAQRDADERLTTTLSLMPAMGERPAMAMLGLCFTGTDPRSPVIRPFLELGTVLSSDVTARPYAEILEHAERPVGMRVAIDNTLLDELDDSSTESLATLHASGAIVALRALGGAFGRVAPDATAFGYRGAEVMVAAMRVGPGPEAPTVADDPAWARVTARGAGCYLNFRSERGGATHPTATAARLAELRALHDPTGLLGG